MKSTADHELAYCLSASAVDTVGGVLSGVTVAKSGVRAKGKYVLLDASGNITRDPKQAKSRLPVFTDEKFLDTLMGAAQDAGGKVKVRSDHDDALQARAGYATNFRRLEDRVICDIHLLKSYRDRATVIETAASSPELIGCSIDFVPSFEVQKDKAIMRAELLTAVDIVDEGAVTPGGLFMRSGVDNDTKDETALPILSTETSLTMAKETEKAPLTVDDCMAALTSLSETVKGLAASFASLSKPAAPVTDPAVMSAIDELKTQLKATAELVEKQAGEITKLSAGESRKNAALGLKASDAKLADVQEQEAERVRLAAEKDADGKKPKGFLALVKAKKDEGKLSAYEAHRQTMAAHPGEYEAYLIQTGVAKARA